MNVLFRRIALRLDSRKWRRLDVLVQNLVPNSGRTLQEACRASNWSIQRLEAANDYARRNGLAGFAAISNNFSLARMIAPPWPGCFSSSDAAWRVWLTKTQMPIMPWSSQARGFFTERAAPECLSDSELVRCWYSDDNFARLSRVEQLAAERGVQPIAIALAWVLG